MVSRAWLACVSAIVFSLREPQRGSQGQEDAVVIMKSTLPQQVHRTEATAYLDCLERFLCLFAKEIHGHATTSQMMDTYS
jgi:hypothetical protein